jgi:NDP-sugar pyrophosphorylase family protein
LNSSFQRCLLSRLMHHSSKVPTSVTLLCRCTGTVADAGRFGTVMVDDGGAIRSFEEKRGLAVPGWINAGVYLLSRQLLELLPAGRAVSLEKEAFPAWSRRGLGGFRTRSAFLDIGTPESFARAEPFLAGVGAAS